MATGPNGYLGSIFGTINPGGKFVEAGRFGVSPASPAEPPSPPKGRPSPPTGPDCSCVGERHGRPVAHHGLCRLYSVEDEAWCRTKWVDAKTGRAPTYDEALATVRGGSAAPSPDEAAEAPTRYAVPSEYVTVSLPARTTAELLQDLEDSLRDGLHVQAEIKARHLAGWRCGACYACRGIDADPRCRRERITVDRDAIRRLWCHAQAVDRMGLGINSAMIFDLLCAEIGNLAAQAGIK